MNLMKYFPISLFPYFLIILLFGCDKIEGPVLEQKNISTDTCIFTDTLAQPRKVLLEDYTGHKCGNCPEAGDLAKTLKQQYGEKLVVMAVHAGYFAAVTAPGTTMDYNFKTEAGEYWNTFFHIDQNPSGMINRSGYPTCLITPDFNGWDTSVAKYMNIPAYINIFMVNQYDSATRKLTTCLKTKFINSLSSTYKLTVCVIEDSIIKPQIDDRLIPANDTIYNFVHNHVLRGAISSKEGDDLASTPPGGSAFVSYTYTLPPEWVPARCSIIAFVFDGATYEVIQAEEKKVIP